jgi:hypothetical protein
LAPVESWSIVVSTMFTFRAVEAMEVKITGMSDSLHLGVVKAEGNMYFKATKNNRQLQHILNKSIGQKSYYSNNMSCTTVMESIKKLRDAKYKDHLQQAPQQTRSKRFKAFVLRIPESVVIKAPAVGNVSSIDLRVLMSSLVYVKCDF